MMRVMMRDAQSSSRDARRHPPPRIILIILIIIMKVKTVRSFVGGPSKADISHRIFVPDLLACDRKRFLQLATRT
eukprot:915299-Pyramimonas_sp.AAC.1